MFQKASLSSNVDKAMSPEQFNQVVDAILAGKYSWACVLILRFAGYNPLHYIPYRTYNRLVKENSQAGQQLQSDKGRTNKGCLQNRTDRMTASCSKIADLSYVEEVREKRATVRGGTFAALLSSLHKPLLGGSDRKDSLSIRH